MNKTYSYNTIIMLMVAIAMIVSGVLLCLGLKSLDQVFHEISRVGCGLIFIASGIAILVMKNEEREKRIKDFEKELKDNTKKWQRWIKDDYDTNPPSSFKWCLVKTWDDQITISRYCHDNKKWHREDGTINDNVHCWKELS